MEQDYTRSRAIRKPGVTRNLLALRGRRPLCSLINTRDSETGADRLGKGFDSYLLESAFKRKGITFSCKDRKRAAGPGPHTSRDTTHAIYDPCPIGSADEEEAGFSPALSD